MEHRQLGRVGPNVGPIGLGCMNIAGIYGPADRTHSLEMFRRAVALGVDHFDTADIYGMGFSEELISEFVARDNPPISIATKGGIRTDPKSRERKIDNSPDYIRSALEASLRRLNRDCVDLYYIHRKEPGRDIEGVVGTLVDLKQEGKLKAIGFSEISPAALRQAHAVHPIAAVQSEYSLWTRGPEDGLLEVCQELGVAFVAFSPLARGMLTGPGVDPHMMEPSDFRRLNPRFMGENYQRNVAAIDKFRALAADMGHAPSALALAWLLNRDPNLIVIPGTRTIDHLEENLDGDKIRLSQSEMMTIEDVFPEGFPFGARYSEQQRGRTQDDDN